MKLMLRRIVTHDGLCIWKSSMEDLGQVSKFRKHTRHPGLMDAAVGRVVLHKELRSWPIQGAWQAWIAVLARIDATLGCRPHPRPR